MMRKACLALAALIGLAGCESGGSAIKAPTARGVCWYLADKTGGGVNINKVAENVPNLESCAAKLEVMRLQFLRMGGSNADIVGAYQGNFLFLTYKGIHTSRTLDGARYLVLVRYGNSLVMPGAVPQ